MCDKCDYENYINLIDDILDDEDYYFAEDTLVSIRNWIENNEHITEAQKTAVHNIKDCIRE